jgi:signal peptidase I
VAGRQFPRHPAEQEDVVRFVAWATTYTVLALLALTVAPVLIGWRSDVVMSGSMMPGIAPGDIVISRPAAAPAIEVGQVALVVNPARPDTTLIHRVVNRTADGSLITRGDANAGPDTMPVPPSLVLAQPRLRVPYIGLPLLWAHTGQYGHLLLLAGVAALVVAALRPAAATGRRAAPAHRAGAGRGPQPAAPGGMPSGDWRPAHRAGRSGPVRPPERAGAGHR